MLHRLLATPSPAPAPAPLQAGDLVLWKETTSTARTGRILYICDGMATVQDGKGIVHISTRRVLSRTRGM